MPDLNLADRTALVTGASRGIARGFAARNDSQLRTTCPTGSIA